MRQGTSGVSKRASFLGVDPYAPEEVPVTKPRPNTQHEFGTMSLQLRRDRTGSLSKDFLAGGVEAFEENDSQRSDTLSQADHPMFGLVPASSKISEVATEIAALETRCEQLESRNKWLTKSLMQSQRTFIERNMVSNAATKVRHCFNAWATAMSHLRVEHQLEDQTVSLAQCQQAVKDLAAALSSEQQGVQKVQAQVNASKAQYRRLTNENGELRKRLEENGHSLDIMEKRLAEAESALGRSRADALSVIERADLYQSRRREIESEHREAREAAKQPNEREHRSKIKEESRQLVAGVQGLLQANRAPSPELEHPEQRSMGYADASPMPQFRMQKESYSAQDMGRLPQGTTMTVGVPMTMPSAPTMQQPVYGAATPTVGGVYAPQSMQQIGMHAVPQVIMQPMQVSQPVQGVVGQAQMLAAQPQAVSQGYR
eukprot:gnl/TRDRNA2_/TRDRNA2_174397_c0_seq1.p1 gnl/TRDRNA2_/TRDRNA2_174397_c0~~gnl/TRDRNA2_/TRDRNA2_174397_c0_seq1.p1  ORF type:complete len:430 (+),score=81.14 gnl/TRDRNA2_/TRDRNA2_174397_c0_seq1:89-1378(+)